MRLHRLEVCGFGPFRDRQVVDFDVFSDDGIFLIGGRTGAGKSSILDAVCFGLYGGVPRYDGGEKRLRSDHCDPDDPTEVVVEFSTVSGRYRVTRTPAYERPKRSGVGITTQQASALLEQHFEGEWVGRAARAVDVAHELDDILQLSQEQFLQVILLAQNRFADFLLADSRERQALLRRLFGTERFSDYQARLEERRREAEQALAGRQATVNARLGEAERLVATNALWGDDSDSELTGAAPRLERLDRAAARAAYRVEQASTERLAAEKTRDAADATLSELKEQQQAQVERDRARTALRELDATAPQVAEDAARRDRARAAEMLRAHLDAARRAVQHAAAAAEVEQEARSAAGAMDFPETVQAAVASTDDSGTASSSASERLRAWASETTRESGAWQRAAELEADTAQRDAELAAAEASEESAAAALRTLQDQHQTLPARVQELTEQRDAARRAGDTLAIAGEAITTAEQRLAATVESARLVVEIAQATDRELDATRAHAQAQGELADLRARRLSGYAGELAQALVEGGPCAVCGSTVHPKPASHTDPVSADDIAAAEERRDLAAASEREASQRVTELALAHAAADLRAAGRDQDAADAELRAAQEHYRAAEAAAKQAVVLSRELTQLQQEVADTEQRRAAATDALHEARTALSLCRQRCADAEKAVSAARGTHASVAERLAAAERRIAAATALADAIDAHIAARARVTETETALTEAIGASPFTDAVAAEDALLTPAAIAALDERVTDHRVAREKERAILLDLELRMLPEDPIDLTPAQEQATAARAAWAHAADEDSKARNVHDALGCSIAGAREEHVAAAADLEEFETLRGLADTLSGRAGNTHKMNLETFVLAAELEEIVAAANLRLRDMSDGRYELRHSDALAARGAASGLGIVVFDAFTGQTRPARSLSGGETFLSSLALALGLAEVVTARAGGIHLDTLFIDEGFGSLDSDTLETAMRTLDELRQGGRTVGVISHVEAMQEQIPAQLTVRALPDGPSIIEAPRR